MAQQLNPVIDIPLPFFFFLKKYLDQIAYSGFPSFNFNNYRGISILIACSKVKVPHISRWPGEVKRDSHGFLKTFCTNINADNY